MERIPTRFLKVLKVLLQICALLSSAVAAIFILMGLFFSHPGVTVALVTACILSSRAEVKLIEIIKKRTELESKEQTS